MVWGLCIMVGRCGGVVTGNWWVFGFRFARVWVFFVE